MGARSRSIRTRKVGAGDRGVLAERRREVSRIQQSLAKIGKVIGEALATDAAGHRRSEPRRSVGHAARPGARFASSARRICIRLLRWGPMAVADLVAEYFETELVARGDRGARHLRNFSRTMVGRKRAGAADSRRGRCASCRLGSLCRRRHGRRHAGHGLRRESGGRGDPHRTPKSSRFA